jgi:putative transposase
VGDPAHDGNRPSTRAVGDHLGGFLRSQAHALLAADFIETVTLTGAWLYVLAVIEHASRRVRVPGATANPNAAWVTQAGTQPGDGPG